MRRSYFFFFFFFSPLGYREPRSDLPPVFFTETEADAGANVGVNSLIAASSRCRHPFPNAIKRKGCPSWWGGVFFLLLLLLVFLL